MITYTVTFEYNNNWADTSSSDSDYIKECDNVTLKLTKEHGELCSVLYDKMEYIIVFSYDEFVRLQEELSDYTFFFFKMPPQWIKEIVDYRVKDRNKKIIIKISKNARDYLMRRILTSNKFHSNEKNWIYAYVYNETNKRRI